MGQLDKLDLLAEVVQLDIQEFQDIWDILGILDPLVLLVLQVKKDYKDQVFWASRISHTRFSKHSLTRKNKLEMLRASSTSSLVSWLCGQPSSPW